MILLIYYKLKYISRMFYNKVYFTFHSVKAWRVRMFDLNINVIMSTNGPYAVDILPEKEWNFDLIENCLIFETDDDQHKKNSKTSKTA